MACGGLKQKCARTQLLSQLSLSIAIDSSKTRTAVLRESQCEAEELVKLHLEKGMMMNAVLRFQFGDACYLATGNQYG